MGRYRTNGAPLGAVRFAGTKPRGQDICSLYRFSGGKPKLLRAVSDGEI